MSNPMIARSRRFTLLALWLCAFGAAAQAPAGAGAAPADYLDMQARAAAYRAYADRWLALARTGDVAALAQTISPSMTARVGAEAVRRNLETRVVPFFAQAPGLGRSVTVTQTTDAFGHGGFAFYMYALPKDGAPRPFVLYVVDEGGARVVANIVVDHHVPDRHR